MLLLWSKDRARNIPGHSSMSLSNLTSSRRTLCLGALCVEIMVRFVDLSFNQNIEAHGYTEKTAN
jgi:hypothetical protein